eukprot:2484976-Rhodomonas_salina.3
MASWIRLVSAIIAISSCGAGSARMASVTRLKACAAMRRAVMLAAQIESGVMLVNTQQKKESDSLLIVDGI